MAKSKSRVSVMDLKKVAREALDAARLSGVITMDGSPDALRTSGNAGGWLQAHDDRYHGGHYEEGQTCRLRDKLRAADDADRLEGATNGMTNALANAPTKGDFDELTSALHERGIISDDDWLDIHNMVNEVIGSFENADDDGFELTDEVRNGLIDLYGVYHALEDAYGDIVNGTNDDERNEVVSGSDSESRSESSDGRKRDSRGRIVIPESDSVIPVSSLDQVDRGILEKGLADIAAAGGYNPTRGREYAERNVNGGVDSRNAYISEIKHYISPDHPYVRALEGRRFDFNPDIVRRGEPYVWENSMSRDRRKINENVISAVMNNLPTGMSDVNHGRYIRSFFNCIMSPDADVGKTDGLISFLERHGTNVHAKRLKEIFKTLNPNYKTMAQRRAEMTEAERNMSDAKTFVPTIDEEIKRHNDSHARRHHIRRSEGRVQIENFGQALGFNCYKNDLATMLRMFGYDVKPARSISSYDGINGTQFYALKNAFKDAGFDYVRGNGSSEMADYIRTKTAELPNGTWISTWSGGHNTGCVLYNGHWYTHDSYHNSHWTEKTPDQIANYISRGNSSSASWRSPSYIVRPNDKLPEIVFKSEYVIPA